MNKCPECKSSDLRWYLGKRGSDGIQDGRLRMHDVSVIAYLACEECSETLRVVQEHEVEEMLNAGRRAEFDLMLRMEGSS